AISRRGGIAPGYGSGALEARTPRSTLEHPAVFGPAEVAPAGHQRRRQFDRGVVAVHDHGCRGDGTLLGPDARAPAMFAPQLREPGVPALCAGAVVLGPSQTGVEDRARPRR